MAANNPPINNQNAQPYMNYPRFDPKHNFAEYVAQIEKNYLIALTKSKNAPPFRQDPQKGMINYNRVNMTGYMHTQSRRILDREVMALNDEQRTRMHEFVVQHWQQYRRTEDEQPPAAPGDVRPGRVQFAAIGDGLTQVLSEEKLDELNHEIQYATVNPKSGFRDRSRNVDYLEAQRIQELKGQIDANDPQRREKLTLLDKANEATATVKREVVAYYNDVDSSSVVAGLKGMTAEMDDYFKEEFHDYLQTYKDGALKEKYPRRKSMSGVWDYDSLSDTNVQGASTYGLNAQEEQELENFKPQLSDELKQTVRDFFAEMDAIGEENYRNGITVNGSGQFRGEQGIKMYGFWPICKAKSAVQQALEEGDMAKLATAQEEYDRVKGHTDKLMELTKKHKAPIFSGNINSTRPQNHGFNDVPDEYLRDYTGHNIVNGMFLLWAYCKNHNLTADQLLENPPKTYADAAREKQQQTGLTSHHSIAGQLAWGFSGDAAGAQNGSMYNDQYLLGRGMTTLAAFGDPQERREIIASNEFACVAGNVAVRREKTIWEYLSETDDVDRRCLYEQAAVLPTEDFDILALGEKIQANGPISLDETLESLRVQGKLDLEALAQRTQQVLDDSAGELETLDQQQHYSKFSKRQFIASSLKAYRRIVETATIEEEVSPGLEALKGTMAGMEKKMLDVMLEADEDGELAESLERLDSGLAAVKQRKEGFGILAPNSPEHEAMTKAVTRLNRKLQMMQGREVPGITEAEREELRNADLNKELRKARKATYEYYRLKTENGTKTTFSVGAGRKAAAARILNALDFLQDQFGSRTTARRIIQENQKELMGHANDEEWLTQNVSRKAAEMMVAMHEAYAHPGSSEKQMTALRNTRIDTHVTFIQGTQPFQRMIQDVPTAQLAKKMIEGGGQLTEVYVTAKNAVDPVEGAKPAREMTSEEKSTLWREQEIGQPQHGHHV